jgi:hypothetical protein
VKLLCRFGPQFENNGVVLSHPQSQRLCGTNLTL